MRFFISLIVGSVLILSLARAEDAGELREKGIAALKESQANPRKIVEAARAFAKAAEAYTAAGDEEKPVEMNSFLYWCKKKMTLEDIEAFTKGGEAAVAQKLAQIEKIAPKVDEAQVWLERAEKFAAKNPNEHLLIAVRFFEVADRFKGTDSSLKAQDRSLKEIILAQAQPVISKPPPENAARAKDMAGIYDIVDKEGRLTRRSLELFADGGFRSDKGECRVELRWSMTPEGYLHLKYVGSAHSYQVGADGAWRNLETKYTSALKRRPATAKGGVKAEEAPGTYEVFDKNGKATGKTIEVYADGTFRIEKGEKKQEYRWTVSPDGYFSLKGQYSMDTFERLTDGRLQNVTLDRPIYMLKKK